MNAKQNIYIEGIGIAGGFGSGVEELKSVAQNPTSNIQHVPVPGGPQEPALPLYKAPAKGLEQFVSKRAARRIDHYSKLALLGAFLALEDGQVDPQEMAGSGVIIASGYGATSSTFAFLDTVIEDGDICASPTHFSNSVHNAASAYVSMNMGIRGPNLTVSQFELSFASALQTACCWLAQGRVNRVLLGGVDEYCDVLGYCWDKFFGPVHPNAVKPFALEEQTAICGEGSCFFLLTTNPSAAAYGKILQAQSGLGLQNPENLSTDALILGADGHVSCGSYYASFMSGNHRKYGFSPIFGSFPTNQSMDMALACLMLKDNTPYTAFSLQGKEKTQTAAERIDLLKFGPQGRSGHIRIEQC